ncbi:MAG TPA: glycosyltransferase family 39 protein [Actinomycetota bacterium]|nr:glycosyltransferase family 39 protein [Actinomycetota bacterium]
MTPRAYRWGLVGCYGVHLTICLLLLVVLVPHGIHRLSALVVTYGGDQVRYRYQALSLSRGHLPRSPYPIGTGLLLVPLVFTLRKLTPAALGTEVVMVWGVLGFALGLVAVSAIARRVFKRNRVALVAAFLWCVAPLGTYVAVRFAHGASFAYGTAAPTAWLQILSDGPETLCALAAILAYGKARESPRPAWAALAGALGGFAILLRYTGALLFVVVVVAFAFERPSRRAVVAGVSGLLVVLPQLVINRLQLGSPLRTGYQAGSIASTNRFSFAFIGHGVGHLAGQVGWLLLPIGVLAAAVGLVGVADLLRRRMALTSLLVGWLGALVALQAVFEGTWEGGWPRYLMPVYAVLALVAAAALERGVAWCRRWLPDRHSEHRRSSSLQESGPPL